jgi:transcriptional regulator with XRE-family HTH domain
LHGIRDNSDMARKIRMAKNMSGLYYAREARHMPRSELVRLTGISKQQLSRLENGTIRMRLDHLRPFAKHLGFTPEQILLWGKLPGTGDHIESSDILWAPALREEGVGPPKGQIPELDTRAGLGGGGILSREVRKEGRNVDPFKSEGWVFPVSFVREQLHSAPSRLLVLDTNGDSMAPTILSGERVIVDTGHKTPTPDGLYAIRDTFGAIVVKRLQVVRSSKPTRVKIISDNPNHNNEETPLADVEIVGKVLSCLKLF